MSTAEGIPSNAAPHPLADGLAAAPPQPAHGGNEAPGGENSNPARIHGSGTSIADPASHLPESTPRTGGDPLLANTWSQLQKQRWDLEKRSQKLDALRKQFAQYIERERQPSLAESGPGEDQSSTGEQEPPGLLRSANGEPGQTSTPTRLWDAVLGEFDATTRGDGVQATGQGTRGTREVRIGTLVADRRRMAISAVTGICGCLLILLWGDLSFPGRVELALEGATATAQFWLPHRLALAGELSSLNEDRRGSVRISNPTLTVSPDGSRLLVHADLSERKAGLQKLQSTAEDYVSRVRLQQEAALAHLRRDVEANDLETAALREKHEVMLGELNAQQQELIAANPKPEVERVLGSIASSRAEFEAIESELARTKAELVVVRAVDVPERPEVDLASRRLATQNDLYLQQDLKALGVRLEQLRHHLVDVFASSPAVLRDLSSATNNLGILLESEKLGLESRAALDALAALAAQAADLDQLTQDFLKAWKQHGENLQKLTIDSQDRTCLNLQRSIEDLVKNFIFDAGQSMETLQPSYQKLSQELSDSAEHFKLRNGIVAELRSVAQQHTAFSEFAKRVSPEKDFQLNAILHTVVGLTRRVADRQATIETGLAQEKKKQIESERTTRQQKAEQRLVDLQRRREAVITGLLAQQDELNRLVPKLEEHGATVATLPYTKAGVGSVADRLGQLASERSALEAKLASGLEVGGALRVEAGAVDLWPADGAAAFSTPALGGGLAAIAAYLVLVLRIAGNRRQDAGGPA